MEQKKGMSDSQMIQAARPAAMAREKLSQALGQVQDIPGSPKGVDKVTELIAGAIRALFEVQSSEPDEPAHVDGVKKAMENLTHVLEALQEVEARGEAIDAATSTVAQTLAVLYPVAQSQARGPLPTETPLPKPLPRDGRRSAQRVGVEADVGFQSESHFYTGFTQNISEGGLFIATYDVQELDTEMAVSFTLPDGHLVSCKGVVKWVREYNDTTPDMHPGMGLKFIDLTSEDRKAIERFLAERPAFFYEA